MPLNCLYIPLLSLWNLEEEPMGNLVAAQMRLLRCKLASYGCPCPIETVPGTGYRFNSQPPSQP